MTRRLSAIPASPGRARGPAWLFEATRAAPPAPPGAVTVAEAARAAARTLETLAERLRAAGRPAEAEILEAQAAIATDPSLIDAASRRVADGTDPAAAVRDAADAVAGRLAASPNAVTAARAADVTDVGDRIARAFEGGAIAGPGSPAVAVARDLPPSAIVEIPAGLLLAVALEEGSPTAHVALLARALGIPVVVGAVGIVAAVAEEPSAFVEVDGGEGWVAVAGPADAGAGIATSAHAGVAPQAHQAPDAHREMDAPTANHPGATADGHRVALLANLGRAREVDAALAAGAEGVGLFRTEALFLGRSAMPSEATQRVAYRRVLVAMAGRPVVVRIADLGGDRPVSYVARGPEANPALGVRGIRLARRDPALHLAQLRAIARAAADAGMEPRILAPMISTLDDARFFRDLVQEAWSLEAAGGAALLRPLLGVMVEVPAAALVADRLVGIVDFLSVGTNDLAQYALAADRGSAALALTANALDPAVLRLVRMAVDAGREAGIPVGACGALAGDPAGALVLAGLGMDSLSTEPASIARVRAALASVTMSALRELADAAVRASSAAEVQGLARDVRPPG